MIAGRAAEKRAPLEIEFLAAFARVRRGFRPSREHLAAATDALNPALLAALDRSHQTVLVPDGPAKPVREFLDSFTPVVRSDSPLPQNLGHLVRRWPRLCLGGPLGQRLLRGPADNLQILSPGYSEIYIVRRALPPSGL